MQDLQVFIGTTEEKVTYGRSLIAHLQHHAACRLADTAFLKNDSFLGNLKEIAETYDFAVLLLTPDDKLETRQLTWQCARDNLIFEAGLFFATLGGERTFVVRPAGMTDFKIPSNLSGINLSTYDDHHQNPRDAIMRTAIEVLEAIEKLGTRRRNREAVGTEKPNSFSKIKDVEKSLIVKRKGNSLVLNSLHKPTRNAIKEIKAPWSGEGWKVELSAANEVLMALPDLS